MRASVAVTAFEQRHELMNVFAALRLQFHSESMLVEDLIVIDNGSDPPLRPVVFEHEWPVPVHYVYRARRQRNFRPGTARNIALKHALGEVVLFLDGDCIPGPSWLRAHHDTLAHGSPPAMSLGHRVFVNGDDIDPGQIRHNAGSLEGIKQVPSSSNYGLVTDRRLDEFSSFWRHPLPCHCAHGCNMAVSRRKALDVGGFDPVFDGYWGYEDIEFAYRLSTAGVPLRYTPAAFVYHQEGVARDTKSGGSGGERNYRIACDLVPGLDEFKRMLRQPYYERLLDDSDSSSKSENQVHRG